jgi:hypothetical protein
VYQARPATDAASWGAAGAAGASDAAGAPDDQDPSLAANPRPQARWCCCSSSYRFPKSIRRRARRTGTGRCRGCLDRSRSTIARKRPPLCRSSQLRPRPFRGLTSMSWWRWTASGWPPQSRTTSSRIRSVQRCGRRSSAMSPRRPASRVGLYVGRDDGGRGSARGECHRGQSGCGPCAQAQREWDPRQDRQAAALLHPLRKVPWRRGCRPVSRDESGVQLRLEPEVEILVSVAQFSRTHRN